MPQIDVPFTVGQVVWKVCELRTHAVGTIFLPAKSVVTSVTISESLNGSETITLKVKQSGSSELPYDVSTDTVFPSLAECIAKCNVANAGAYWCPVVVMLEERDMEPMRAKV